MNIAERCQACGASLREVQLGSGLLNAIRTVYVCGHSFHPFIKPVLLPPSVMIICDECGEPVEKKTWKTKRHHACQNTHYVRVRKKARLKKLQEKLEKDGVYEEEEIVSEEMSEELELA